MQFGINSTSEWLLIARGEAESNYANHESQIVQENMLLIANHKPCQVDSTLHKYEHVWDSQVYGIHGIQVYSKMLIQVTDQSLNYYIYALLTVCFQLIKRALTLLHCWQSVFQPIIELLTLLHCWQSVFFFLFFFFYFYFFYFYFFLFVWKFCIVLQELNARTT